MPRCKNCQQKFTPTRFLQKYCEEDECKQSERISQSDKKSVSKPKVLKKIAPISEKRKVENLKYQSQRIIFLGKPENKICPITKKPTTDIHHSKGRIGSLFLDERYWIALSREGHKRVEENPEWAKENGFSLNRLSNELD